VPTEVGVTSRPFDEYSWEPGMDSATQPIVGRSKDTAVWGTGVAATNRSIDEMAGWKLKVEPPVGKAKPVDWHML
jgi:hypothetical protein